MASNKNWIAGITLALALALAIVGQSAAAAGYYRWTDDDGQTHFSQNPPENRPSEFVSRATGRPSSEPQTNAEPESSEKTETDTEAENGDPEQLQALPEKDPERCKQARNLLQTLDGYARVRARQPDGSYRVLTEEEKNEQRERAEEAIDIHC